MIAGLERNRSEGCVSDLALDQLLLEELDDARRSEVKSHIESCASCRERLEAIEEDRARFQQSAPPFAPEAITATTSSAAANDDSEGATVLPFVRRLAPVVGVLAAAAAVLLLVPKTPEAPEPDILTKGKSFVSFFVKRGDAVTEGKRGQRVFPNDQLRFVIETKEDAYAAVLSKDGAGTLSVYYPDAEMAAEVKGSLEPVALPSATVLDEVMGRETVHAFLCEQSTSIDALRSAVTGATGDDVVKPPASCRVDSFSLLKTPREGAAAP